MQIQIPVQLQKAMRELPPIPPFNEYLPMPPPPSPEPVKVVRGAIAITGLMIFVGFVNTFSPILGAILFPIGLFLILAQMFVQYKTYQSRLRDHTALTESYFLLLQSYSRKQSEHEQRIFRSQTSDRLREFRSPRILEILSSTNTEIIQKILVGDTSKSELVITDLITDKFTDEITNQITDEPSKFTKSLNRSLGDNLHQGITVQIPGFNYIFSPDFTYIDPISNLHLAIAITEPSGKNSDKNIKEQQNICHTFLLKSGWIVVNLSPNEVLDQPDRRLQEIFNLIQELTCESKPLLSGGNDLKSITGA